MPSTAIASDYLEAKLYDHALRNTPWTSPTTVYAALFDVDPGDDGASGTEHSGAGYARQAVTFGAPADGTGSNSGKVTYPTATADWGQTGGWALFDAVTAGNILFHGSLETSKYVSEGQTPEFETGDLEITFA